jgi:glycosyltransferase involved in cell wall biosynthesis
VLVAVDASCLSDGRAVAGIGRYANELLTALRGCGEHVDVRAAAPRGEPRSNRWAYRWARSQPAIAALAKRMRPQLLHGLASEVAACFPLPRQVVTVHDVVPWTGPPPATPDARVYLRLQHALLRRAGGIIVPAQVVIEDVSRVFGVSPDRITAIEHGVTAAFSPAPGERDDAVRAALGLDGRPYAMWVGSLHGQDPRKGLDVLLDAVGSLPPGSRPLLVLVGKHGAGSKWVTELARANGVDVLLPGFIDDSRLAALYRGAAAAVVPSRYEGFGLPALEALACGAPVVVTDAGNSPALVRDAALVVPAGDARALTNGLRAVLEDPLLQRRLRTAGPSRAGAFSWRRAAERTVEVYERVLGGSARQSSRDR